MSELARRPASAELAAVYQPTTFEQGWKIAQFIARSNLCPSALANKPESVWMIMSKGAELGVSAMIALAEIHIIKGRAVLSSRLMTSFVTRAPECEYFRMVHSDDVRATFETKHRDHPTPTPYTWTIDMAKAAGLCGKDNWRNFPAAMLRARCTADLARICYPDRSIGLYLRDELGTVIEGEWSDGAPAMTPLPEDEPAAATAEPEPKPQGVVIIDKTTTSETVDPETGEVTDAPASDDDESKPETWLRWIEECETRAQLDDMRPRIKPLPQELRDAIRPAFQARQGEVT